jgi:hypothetical protein
VPLDHFLNAQMSLVSASSSVFCNQFLFSIFIWFLRFLIALLVALFVSGEIVLVSCISCLALVFQLRVILSAFCIFAFHHGLAFSEGWAIFAVLWVASIRASCSADAASSACVCDRLMLVMLVNAFWRLSIVSENASIHFLASVSFRSNLGLLDGVFVCRWPWSIVQVMGTWSVANESS